VPSKLAQMILLKSAGFCEPFSEKNNPVMGTHATWVENFNRPLVHHTETTKQL
ncbi:hypothetical protein AVEN_238530-1, partial [Araneus ventricosus]